MQIRSSLALRWAVFTLVVASLGGAAALAGAVHGVFRQQSVGGIAVTTEGIVGPAIVDSSAKLRQQRLLSFRPVPMDLGRGVEMRKISLRGLEMAIRDALDNGREIPEPVAFLGGIQRLEYIFVYPEQKDIVLAGPGEGWKVNEKGDYVGVTTGRPVIHLEDLLIAFRSVEEARQGGITCSIDPTPEGVQRLNAFLRQQRQFTPVVLRGAEQALGPQQITITGVPADTHFARALVAADFHMKRIAMKLDPSHVEGLPSYLDLLKTSPRDMMPRWWLACSYEPVAKSPDGLAWQIRGQGVKAFTEDEAVTKEGKFQGSGRTDPTAQKWADLMSANYDKLMDQQMAFCELRNIMDLCVIAAVIEKEGLFEKAGCEIPLIARPNATVPMLDWPAPKMIPTQCSFIKKGRETIITASGGVEVNSWEAASSQIEKAELSGVREKASSMGSQWYWN